MEKSPREIPPWSIPTPPLVALTDNLEQTFTAFVFFDMFNALTCRSATHTCLPLPNTPRLHLFSNKLFNFAVSASLIGQLLVIYLPFLQKVFQTEAIGLGDLIRLVIL